jgi:hypothetical protein
MAGLKKCNDFSARSSFYAGRACQYRPARLPNALSGLTFEQEQNAGCQGQDGHDYIQPGKAEMEQGGQSNQDEPDAQKQDAQSFWNSYSHFFILSLSCN